MCSRLMVDVKHSNMPERPSRDSDSASSHDHDPDSASADIVSACLAELLTLGSANTSLPSAIYAQLMHHNIPARISSFVAQWRRDILGYHHDPVPLKPTQFRVLSRAVPGGLSHPQLSQCSPG
jgi:hypothetical protein